MCLLFPFRYGRKKTALPCWAAVISIAFISSFVEDYWIFLFVRFLIGIFQGGPIMLFNILAVELVGPKHRSLATIWMFISYSIAFTLVGIQAWLIPNWKYLQIVTSIPYIPALFLGYRYGFLRFFYPISFHCCFVLTPLS